MASYNKDFKELVGEHSGAPSTKIYKVSKDGKKRHELTAYDFFTPRPVNDLKGKDRFR
jgi:hypothetical protein